MPLISSGLSDIGQKRKTNQDSIYISKSSNLFIVADGMGGHNGGDIASQTAVKVFPEFMQENKDTPVDKRIINSIHHANRSIFDESQKKEELVGMGTTIVSLYFKNDTLYIGNVGDSRAYLVNKQKLFQLSADHSLVQEKINMGIYSREQAAKDPHKNVLVRTVGFELDLEVDLFTYKVCRNDIFLLCSDGLHGKVSDEDIVHLVNSHLPTPSQATQEDLDQTVQALIDQANANGGNDNISVIIILAQ